MTQKNWNHSGRIRKWIPPKDKTTSVFVSGFGRIQSNAIRWVMCITVSLHYCHQSWTEQVVYWGFSPAAGCSPASAETQCSSALISCCRKHNTPVLMNTFTPAYMHQYLYLHLLQSHSYKKKLLNISIVIVQGGVWGVGWHWTRSSFVRRIGLGGKLLH